MKNKFGYQTDDIRRNQSRLKMQEQRNHLPVVTYEQLNEKGKEAEAGLDRAFEILFEEVLKTKKREVTHMRETMPEAKIDS